MGDHPAYRLIDRAICSQAGPGFRWEPVGDQESNMLLARLSGAEETCRIPLDLAEFVLDVIRGELESMVDCFAVFRENEVGELVPVPGTVSCEEERLCRPLLKLVRDLEAIVTRPVQHENPQWLDDLIDGDWSLTAEGCSGHVASAADPSICGKCGIHIDELRPAEDDDAKAGA